MVVARAPAADFIVVGDLVPGVEGVGIGFAGDAVGDGLSEGGEGGFVIEAFTGVRLGLAQGMFQ